MLQPSTEREPMCLLRTDSLPQRQRRRAVEEDFDKAIDRAFAVGMKKEEVAELVSLLLEEK